MNRTTGPGSRPPPGSPPELPGPSPVPQTAAPEVPVPQTAVPRTPALRTPAPQTPVPQTPAPQTPAPQTPAPQTMVRGTPPDSHTVAAPLVPTCPSCGAPLAPATCTLGSVIRCSACHADVSLVLKPGRYGMTFETYVPPKLPDKLPGVLGERFEVVARLGAGGQGEVLRVRPRGATRDYALKWTRASGERTGERGPREANYGVMAAHPNVIAPIQAGWYENLQYMVFDLVEGDTLATLLEREGALPPARACELAHQILRALAHVHANAVIHRDVKPANMLISHDGIVRLTDFGVATSVGTSPGEDLIGTPPYMAPEQVSLEPLSPASDVYAFGCVLFEMLTARNPFERATLIEVLTARLHDPPPPVTKVAPECPEPLARFVARCLSRDPAARPQDGARALAELAEVQRACELDEHVDLPAVPRTSERQAMLDRQRLVHRVRIPAGAVLVSAVLFFAALLQATGGGMGAAVWGMLLTSFALLMAGLRGLSNQLLGAPHLWWRNLLPSDNPDWRDLSGLLAAAAACFGVGLAVLVGLSISSVVAFVFGAWMMAAAVGARGLLSALLELTEEPSISSSAPPELRVFMPDDGWHYRVLPAGQETALPHRIELAEGLNRLEIWRLGSRRRIFLVWAAAGMQLAMHLKETREGPLIQADRRPALPPSRP